MRIVKAPAADRETLPAWPPLLATRGMGAASAHHAHHAMHIVLAVAGELSIQIGDAAAQSAPGVVTAPDVPHAIDAEGKDMLLVFLDPESVAGASLLSALGGAAQLLSAEQRDGLLEGADPLAIMTTRAGDAWTRRAGSILGGGDVRVPRRVHPRVRKALAVLREHPASEETSLEALARAVDLSPGRFDPHRPRRAHRSQMKSHEITTLLRPIDTLAPSTDPRLAQAGQLSVHNQDARYPSLRGGSGFSAPATRSTWLMRWSSTRRP